MDRYRAWMRGWLSCLPEGLVTCHRTSVVAIHLFTLEIGNVVVGRSVGSPKIVWYRRLPSSRPISANRAMRIIDYCYNDGGGTRKVLNKHRTKLISPRWDWEDTIEVRPRISINRTAVEAYRNFLLQPENIAEEIQKPDRREPLAGRYITLTQIRLARVRWNVQGILLATWKPSKYSKGSTKVNRVLNCWWSESHSRKKSLRMFNL